jgi:hypothetical protein
VASIGPRSIARTGAVALLIAGCGGTSIPTSTPEPPAATLAPSALSATGAPTATHALPTPLSTAPIGIWTPITGNLPAGVFYQVQKLEPVIGGHGGPRSVVLPASVAIDYKVSGTCDFGIWIYATGSSNPDPAATFERKVAGETIQDTWPVTLEPGSYVVAPSDANGCTWLVTVREG